MNGIFVLSLFLVFLIPSSVFAIPDIENETIVAESQDKEIVLSLTFGESYFSRFDRLIPNLQLGLLTLGDRIVETVDPRTKIMGNSFVVHSENILIYAKGLNENKFAINAYLIGSNQLEPIKLISVTKEEKDVVKKYESKPIEMIVLVRQDIRTFWNDTYDVEIKVFDKEINPNPRFYQSLGVIEQADVNVILKDSDGNILTQFNGKTDSKGFWKGNYFVLQNLVVGGNYSVEVNVNYLDSNNFQKLETFIVSDTRDAKSSN